MAFEFHLPDIGEGVVEGEIVSWKVKVGDVVRLDQPIVEIMTDKATVEIPSTVSGKVLALGGTVGQVMAVGSEVIRIEVEGVGNLREVASNPAPEPPAAPKSPMTPSADVAVAPSVATPAASSNPPKRIGESVGLPRLARQEGDRPVAAPSVRRRAWDLGVELQYVPGSGPGGRIQHEDLDAYVARAARGVGSTATADQRYAQRLDENALPVIGLRRKIAQKMQEAKRRIPHFTYVEEIDVTDLEQLRQRLNTLHGKARGRLTILPFLARAMVLAVRQFPQINARYDDEADILTQYGAVHLGIATQTDGGLMVPVVRHAETLDLWGSAAEIARLAEAGRNGRATREELSGSTITITSLGALGGIVSTPVINRPEVAIVGVNRMVERPVLRSGMVVARQLMNLSSSFDHRVVDGMHAAEFVQLVRGYLECPATLFVE